MFFLKFLFILFLVVLVILLIMTIFNKMNDPDKSFINCIPFRSDFSDTSVPSSARPNTPAENLKVVGSTKVEATETKVATAKIKSEKPVTNKATTPKKTANKPTSKAIEITKKPSKKSTVKKSLKTKSKGDNIKKVNGIGPVFEKKLNAAGINTFEQIAAWTKADVKRFDNELELSGRPDREDWVNKAKILAKAKKDNSK